MRKILTSILVLATIPLWNSEACTNVIITKGASADGSCMVSYSADSHILYGELYFHPAADHKPGSMLPVTEWDSYRPLGEIPQTAHTYQTVGNMNEHQLIIAETTWGGREEQVDPDGRMDYGSMIYIALQRAGTAREAIKIVVSLANEYGYPCGGETFSIADTEEAWVMDLCGKGKGNKGIVWVARRIPDGYICAHANQARITRFPLNDPENTLYAPDVISFAREKGWFDGKDEEFSFRDAYNPLDFGGARACDARAWSAFNILCDGQFLYEENGNMVSRPANDWLEYAMGHDLKGEMPLWVKPSRKISVKNVADVMRDHFEGTPMDMRKDIGAGGNACPYRWRPMEFSWKGKKYVNERAIATQQTGFWFVSQARGWLPDEIGALMWFGCDDAATSYLTPVYAGTRKVPECLRVGNGDILHYSPTSQFWVCNRVANACYKMYDAMEPVVRTSIDGFENDQMFSKVPAFEKELTALYNKGRKEEVRKRITDYTVNTAQKQFANWVELEKTLLVKFIDGNVKAQDENGNFLHTKYNEGTPEGIAQPGYNDKWKECVAKDNGKILEANPSPAPKDKSKSEITATIAEFTLDEGRGSYTPSFKNDGKNAKVRNVILMIGDGMGLGATASTYFANGKQLTMFNLRTMGYVCTQPLGDFTTDSAASATAYATGEKTKNGRLGINLDLNVLENLPEKLSPLGYACGVLSTDNLHGATPAAFYAHQSTRSARESIWRDLAGSSLSFVSAGSQSVYDNLPLEIQDAVAKAFTIIKSREDESTGTAKRLCYLPESVALKDRGDYLPATTEMAMEYLSGRSKKGFFLMVEGGKIDHEVHSGDTRGMVLEILDFDKAVEAAIRFAEKDGHTLVLISADHETGATAIRKAVPEENMVTTLFGVKGHTGMIVPIFAYGPKSGLFTGIQENSDVGRKIFEILK